MSKGDWKTNDPGLRKKICESETSPIKQEIWRLDDEESYAK